MRVAAVASNGLADRQAANLTRVGEGCDLSLIDHNRSRVTRVSGDVAIGGIIRFDNSISGVFWQTINGDALTVPQENRVTALNRAISRASRADIRILVGRVHKGYCEGKLLLRVAAVACNRLADRQAANIARVGEFRYLGFSANNCSDVTSVGCNIPISRIICLDYGVSCPRRQI